MRKDLLTGEEFVPTRCTQKFASPANRIKYHNIKDNELRKRKEFVNKHLHRNFNILEEIMEGEEQKDFHKQYLIGRGLEFGVLTHYQTYNKRQLPAIYHFLILKLEGDQIRIINSKLTT